MMDVFVIAFLVMTVKLGGIGKVDVHIGIFAFSISVVVSMILTHRIQKKIESIEDVDLV
jgi:paraquat-inducible protein A